MMRQLPASRPDIPQYEVNLKMLNMMSHNDRGQRRIIILIIILKLALFQGKIFGAKKEKVVLSLKCLLIKIKLSMKVFSFQSQTLLFLLI